jgi:hypothetical protein
MPSRALRSSSRRATAATVSFTSRCDMRRHSGCQPGRSVPAGGSCRWRHAEDRGPPATRRPASRAVCDRRLPGQIRPKPLKNFSFSDQRRAATRGGASASRVEP